PGLSGFHNSIYNPLQMTVKHITLECGMRHAECGVQSLQNEIQSLESDVRMPLILAVDTSSPRLSLALARGATVISAIASESGTPHSQTLFVHLAALFDSAQLDPRHVDAFAVATGPGSFTGLRVGLAAVKGLAHT